MLNLQTGLQTSKLNFATSEKIVNCNFYYLRSDTKPRCAHQLSQNSFARVKRIKLLYI